MYRANLTNRKIPRNQSTKRDTNETLENQKLGFSWMGELFYSFEICSSCEAHGIMYSLNKISSKHRSKETINKVTTLQDISFNEIQFHIDFMNCPKRFSNIFYN